MANEPTAQPTPPDMVGVGSKELLACPFCGADVERAPGRSGTRYRCSNEQCPIRPQTAYYCNDYEWKARQEWNGRHANDKVERRAPSTFAPTPGSALKED